MNNIETLFGFMAWLTTREDESVFGEKHDAGLAVDLITEFAKAQGIDMEDIRDNYTDFLIPMK